MTSFLRKELSRKYLTPRAPPAMLSLEQPDKCGNRKKQQLGWKSLSERKEGLLLGHSVASRVYKRPEAAALSRATLTNVRLGVLAGTVTAQEGVSEEASAYLGMLTKSSTASPIQSPALAHATC